MGFGLYLHIPYCLAKCRYCDFYSAGASRGVPDEYVDALIARMAAMNAFAFSSSLSPSRATPASWASWASLGYTALP